MRSLGDKISSTIVAQHAQVPCIPWSGQGIEDVVIDEHGIVTVKDGVYDLGCTHSPQEGLEKAREIGFPVMVKASEGGGGKGIRKVDSEDQFISLYNAAASEIPGSPIFIMKLAGNARHLEVQLLADQYGNNISLFGRDCSVQRRHQKIIEEAPATIANPITFQAMERAAVRLGKLVGYVSAGTVEYLYSHADDKFYFLELNPRLQVEHPTTEMVSGVNLPAAQLQVAMGIPLHRIRDIRLLYGVDPNATTPIDFDFSSEESLQTQRRPKPKGHTTACRITSEDPGEGFKPSGGTMHELNFRSSSNVWGYFSVGTSGGIHSFSDSQFGHIFAYGENRSSSRKHMIVALKELSIRGDFRTTVEYLIKLLETPAFEENTITTGWLDELISKKLTAERPDPVTAVVCGAVAKAHILSEACIAEYRKGIEKGQVPSKEVLKTMFQIDFIYEGFRYKFTATRSSPDGYHIFINGSKCAAGLRALADGGLLVLLDGRSHNVYWKEEPAATRLSVNGKTCLLEQENDPTQLRTPSPGKLVKFTVENGDHIAAGQPFAEVEVMKMYMPLIAQEDGIVQLMKQPGSSLEAGDILGVLKLDDPSKVKHAQPFTGQLPELGTPQDVGLKPSQRFQSLFGILEDILRGFDNQIIMRATLKELLGVLRNQQLPYGEWNAQVSALHSRMPQKLDAQLENVISRAKARNAEFPSNHLTKTLHRYMEDNIPSSDRPRLQADLEPLVEVIRNYSDGLKGHEYRVFIDLAEKYWQVESFFTGRNQRDEDVILKLREQHKDDINFVIDTVLSHTKVESKNNLIIAVMDMYRPTMSGVKNITKYLKPTLKKLAEMDSRATAKVALKARELLILSALPSLEERIAQMEHILRSSVIESTYGETAFEHREPDTDILREVFDSKYTVFDVLPIFFTHSDRWIALAALEVYVRRAYRAYSLKGIHYHGDDEDDDYPPFISWDFVMHKVNRPELGIPTRSFSPATPPADSLSPIKKISSISDMSYLLNRGAAEPLRKGVLMPVQYIDDVEDGILRVLEEFPRPERGRQPNRLAPPHPPLRRRATSTVSPDMEVPDDLTGVIAMSVSDMENKNDEELSARFSELVNGIKGELQAHCIRRISFICGHTHYPAYYTFRGPHFTEDKSIRHSEPALAFQLELDRLSRFDITPVFTQNRNVHVYQAVAEGPDGDKVPDLRYFVRAVVRPGRLRDDIPTVEYLISEADGLMNHILDTLEIIGNSNSDLNHIFINFTPVFKLEPHDVRKALSGFLDRYGRRLWRLRVTAAEIRIMCTDPKTNISYPLRVLVTNTSGYIIQVDMYSEKRSEKGEYIFDSIPDEDGRYGAMHLRPINTPYPTKEWLQPKRKKAHVMGTQYVYDFPELFRQAFSNAWSKAITEIPALAEKRPPPGQCIEYLELVLDEADNLTEISRDPGTNTHGMVGWIVTARTPEYPQGRKFVIVANDITFQIGSFGPQEDHFFAKCTEFSRERGIPRVYLSANSGARIGMAQELIPFISVAWNDKQRPEAGFKYLYITPEVKKRFDARETKDFITEQVFDDGEERHKIVTVIGEKDGLGVECLRGSGLIAGATSKAYEDIFTITLVTCRSVGIGAYLVRLGQRAIQVEGQPIILTGANAINKLLGQEVYSSNLQLGGTQIMYKNGVSHMAALDDFDGIQKIVQWMSFVPAQKNAPVPFRLSRDSWDREVEYHPPAKQAYDVRWMIDGKEDNDGFSPGLFDKGSFQEALGGWARTVVVGRARLGGLPMGVIAVETRSVENVQPADPANPDSMEVVTTEAGGVWYPNSAFKTAQALRDFSNGEQLPVMILANWRGFSGGQRDMYNEVLKYGSYIVDALVKYEQPIFVYIPPFGELRGGSWVVVDPTINPRFMEMYADEESRGGVLEPEGIVNIKYRRDKQLETMTRLDPIYKKLRSEAANPELSPEQLNDIKSTMTERENLLLPVYLQIALQFADLHDRTGRMEAKGAIRKPLQWKNARRFFYWRLRRRLLEDSILRRMEAADAMTSGPSSCGKHVLMLKNWTGMLDRDFDFDDKAVASWYEANNGLVSKNVDAMKTDGVAAQVASLMRSDRKGSLKGVQQMLSVLPVNEREGILKYLAKG